MYQSKLLTHVSIVENTLKKDVTNMEIVDGIKSVFIATYAKSLLMLTRYQKHPSM